MIEYILSVTRGDSATYNLTFTDENGAAINITGWTIFFTVKVNPEEVDDTTALISKTVTTHTTPLLGITKIELSSTDTNIVRGKHYFDIQAKTDTGKVVTVMKGRFEVTYDVTKRIT